MSFKIVNNNDAGTATQFGGDDIDKISRLLNGQANIANVSIDSSWQFRSGRLAVRNPANTFGYIFVSQPLTSNVTLNLPNVLSGTHTIVSRASSDVLENKTIRAHQNNLVGVSQYPSGTKTGFYQAGGVPGTQAGAPNPGQGLLSGVIETSASPVARWQETRGAFWRFNSNSINMQPGAGLRMPARWIWKEHLPSIRGKFKVSTTTNTRFWIGWSWNTQIPSSDTPIASTESAFLLGWRTVDNGTDNTNNFKVFRNGGTSSNSITPSPTDTGIAKGPGLYQYDLRFMQNPSTGNLACRVEIIRHVNTTDIVGTTDYSQFFEANLPAAGIPDAGGSASMSPQVHYSSTTTSDKFLDIYYLEIDQRV